MASIQIPKILRNWPAAAIATCLAIGGVGFALWGNRTSDDFQITATENCLITAAGIQSWSSPREVRIGNRKSIVSAGKNENDKSVEIHFITHEEVRDVIVLSDSGPNKFRGIGFFLKGNQGITTVIANEYGSDTRRARTKNSITTYEEAELRDGKINYTPIEPDDKLRQTHAAALACMDRS